MIVSLLDPSKVEEGSEALLKILENDRTSKTKKLLDVPAPIFLQIDFVKIPKVKRTVVRIPLENSLLTNESDVCLIVADIIRGRRVNHEVTLNHYKKLLDKKGVEEVQKLHVMSSRQIRVDYATFEAKRKLCKMFDIFLIDNKISSYLRPKLGKEFPKARKWPIPVRMKRKNLKEEIASKLKKTSLVLDGSGTTKTVQVGHVKMSPGEISNNIIRISEHIAKRFPGGWNNIRSLHIKGLRSIALPIYMSLISRNDVLKPILEMKRRKRVLATQEVSTIGRKVSVYRSGRVKIHRNSAKSDEEEDDAPEMKGQNTSDNTDEKIDEQNKTQDVPDNKEEKKTARKPRSRKRKINDTRNEEIDLENKKQDKPANERKISQKSETKRRRRNDDKSGENNVQNRKKKNRKNKQNSAEKLDIEKGSPDKDDCKQPGKKLKQNEKISETMQGPVVEDSNFKKSKKMKKIVSGNDVLEVEKKVVKTHKNTKILKKQSMTGKASDKRHLDPISKKKKMNR